VAVALFLYSLVDPIRNADGGTNLSVMQADAFVHKKLDVDHDALDVAVVHDKYYVPFPPAPAVVLLPFVRVLGPQRTNVPVIALVLVGVAVWVARRTLARLNVEPRLQPPLLIALVLGSPVWQCVQGAAGVWFFAHVVAFTCLVLALDEALGRSRGWLVGSWVGVAFLSRQLTIAATVFFVALLVERTRAMDRRVRLRKLIGFGGAVACAVGIYLAFNRVRFGSMFDTGYQYLPRTVPFLAERFKRHGLFSLAYVPFNLFYLLFQGPHVTFSTPAELGGIEPDTFGASLLGASPFVLLAFLGRGRFPCARACWAAIALMTAAHLTYINNGFVQWNTQRFTLDYWPLLFGLVAVGLDAQARRGRERGWYGAIAYAVAGNAFVFSLMDPVNHWLARLG
jgi:hypothetical protein